MTNIEEMRYNAATAQIKAAKAGKLDGLEQEYGISYQALVRAGKAQQIRKKYRVR